MPVSFTALRFHAVNRRCMCDLRYRALRVKTTAFWANFDLSARQQTVVALLSQRVPHQTQQNPIGRLADSTLTATDIYLLQQQQCIAPYGAMVGAKSVKLGCEMSSNCEPTRA